MLCAHLVAILIGEKKWVFIIIIFFLQLAFHFYFSSTSQSRPGAVHMQGRRPGHGELCSVSRRVPREMRGVHQLPAVLVWPWNSHWCHQESCPSGQSWGQSLAHVFSAHSEALCPRAALLPPNSQDRGLSLAEQQKGSRTHRREGEGWGTTQPCPEPRIWDPPQDSTLLSGFLMNTNSCGWLLSLNPYFRISGFTEPEKFGEFPLKLNVCVQQDAMRVHHLTFLLGLVEKILNLLLLWQV